MKNQISICNSRDFSHILEVAYLASYYSPHTNVIPVPSSPLLKRTQSLTMALVTVLLISLAPSTVIAACYANGTASTSSTGCVCKPKFSGEKCNKHNHIGPDGRVQFQAIIGPINWDDGKKLCEDSGMDMGTPWSWRENADMNDLFKPLSRCWIGISNSENANEWKYVSGGRKGRTLWYGDEHGFEDDYYANWDFYEPNNDFEEDSGQMMGSSGKWKDYRRTAIADCVLCETPRISLDNH
eukprot:Tbor_TRINITY_DN5384_c1_g6::TRINITY_DN5384_c1_g6_i1::g.4279::m.4279